MIHIRELSLIPAVQVAAAFAGRRHVAFLDSAMPHSWLGRWSYIACDPFAVFEVRDGVAFLDDVALQGAPLDCLQAVLARFSLPTQSPADGQILPDFQGGGMGYIAYDFGRHLEQLPRPDRGLGAVQDLILPLYDVVVAVETQSGRTLVLSSGLPDHGNMRRAIERADEVAELIARRAPLGPWPVQPLEWRSNFTRVSYEAAVARAVDYVLAGDIFEVNLAQRFEAQLPECFDAFGFYRRLREINPAPFAAWLDFGAVKVASSSPEAFVEVIGRRIETRPIKGTIRRSHNREEDAAAAARLATSEKDRAENVMIVDLLRNDLSRVATPASVDVPVICGLESYASVHHLVSVVTAQLAEGKTAMDVLKASFPGGSITGAPKIRAMEIITELEGDARGVYCGSIGWFGFNGSMATNIAIRTVTFIGDVATFSVGGAVTTLSDPADEYEETLAKAQRIFDASKGAA